MKAARWLFPAALCAILIVAQTPAQNPDPQADSKTKKNATQKKRRRGVAKRPAAAPVAAATSTEPATPASLASLSVSAAPSVSATPPDPAADTLVVPPPPAPIKQPSLAQPVVLKPSESQPTRRPASLARPSTLPPELAPRSTPAPALAPLADMTTQASLSQPRGFEPSRSGSSTPAPSIALPPPNTSALPVATASAPPPSRRSLSTGNANAPQSGVANGGVVFSQESVASENRVCHPADYLCRSAPIVIQVKVQPTVAKRALMIVVDEPFTSLTWKYAGHDFRAPPGSRSYRMQFNPVFSVDDTLILQVTADRPIKVLSID